MAGRLSRRRLGDLCLLCSALILECVALFGVRTVLAAHQLEGQFNLVGETRLELPLPSDASPIGSSNRKPAVDYPKRTGCDRKPG